MIHSLRRKIIEDWLDPQDGMSSAYRPPDFGPAAARQELADIVALLDRVLPGALDESALKELLEQVRFAVAEAASNRMWPLQKTFAAAAPFVLAQPTRFSPREEGFETAASRRFEAKLAAAATFLRAHGQIPSWCNDREVCATMLKRGIATNPELRRAHADVTPDMRVLSGDQSQKGQFASHESRLRIAVAKRGLGFWLL